MAKEKEQKIARILYVEQGKTAKEISALINVSEVTISKWVNNLGWKVARSAKISNPSVRCENIRQIINDLSEQRIELGRQLKEAEESKNPEVVTEIRKQISQIDDAVSKWNKTLESVDKESRISLSTYISVMEMVFEALRQHDEKIFFKLIDFQEQHLNEVAIKFK